VDINDVEKLSDGSLVDTIIRHLDAQENEQVREYLESLHVSEIASLLESLPGELRKQLWALLPPGAKGETLIYLGDEARSSIVGSMEHEDVVAATEVMATEDLAEFIDDLPSDVSDAVLSSLDKDRRIRLETTLAFEEDTAGRLMSTDVISLQKEVSIAVGQRYLRRLKHVHPHLEALMVTDEQGTYLGKLTLADALSEHPSTLV